MFAERAIVEEPTGIECTSLDLAKAGKSLDQSNQQHFEFYGVSCRLVIRALQRISRESKKSRHSHLTEFTDTLQSPQQTGGIRCRCYSHVVLSSSSSKRRH
ncbi:hypothetical protein P7K49_027777 [Saguinus oedipus]|uniref:Uncharacterized protein n=1 Tax=Saguinus oedipus TaxID=9490 RepID=A0ABQ9UAD8_SAGOE|nr:hypothetical protein P7K49_027777 [Saguinus oedipus]